MAYGRPASSSSPCLPVQTRLLCKAHALATQSLRALTCPPSTGLPDDWVKGKRVLELGAGLGAPGQARPVREHKKMLHQCNVIMLHYQHVSRAAMRL